MNIEATLTERRLLHLDVTLTTDKARELLNAAEGDGHAAPMWTMAAEINGEIDLVWTALRILPP